MRCLEIGPKKGRIPGPFNQSTPVAIRDIPMGRDTMLSMTMPMYRRHECRVTGDFVVHLTPLETELLSTLLVLYPRPVTVGDLIEAVYTGEDGGPLWADDIVTNGMRSLAHKVGSYRFEVNGRYIGYRLLQCADDVKRAA